MKSLFPARHGRAFPALLLASTLLPAHIAHAGPMTEAEALARAAALPDTAALDTATSDVAYADAQAVRRFDNPELHLGRERVSGALGAETEWTAEVTQPLGIHGANGRLRAAAAAEAQAVDADIIRRKAMRLAQVRKAYAECGAAAERAAVIGQQAQRLAEVERIIGLRAGAGDAAGYDLRRVRLEAASTSAAKALAEGEVRAACAALTRLTGEADARASEPLVALLQPVLPALTRESGRSDLTAQRYRVNAAEAQAEAARRQRLPDLAVGAGYKRISEGGLSASGPVLALGVKLPIFNGGGAAARAAEARKRAAAAELALSSAAVAAERNAAFARAEAAYDAAQIAARSADDAARITEIADAAYQGGETDITDLIDGYRAGAEARIAAIDHAERALKARADHLLAHEGDE